MERQWERETIFSLHRAFSHSLCLSFFVPVPSWRRNGCSPHELHN